MGHNEDKEMQNLANKISDFIVSEQFQLLADGISREDDYQEFNFFGEENEFHHRLADKIISREDDSQEFIFLGKENELQQVSIDKIWIEVCVQDEQHPNKNQEVEEGKFDFSQTLSIMQTPSEKQNDVHTSKIHGRKSKRGN